jgi:hypothetical protein
MIHLYTIYMYCYFLIIMCECMCIKLDILFSSSCTQYIHYYIKNISISFLFLTIKSIFSYFSQNIFYIKF